MQLNSWDHVYALFKGPYQWTNIPILMQIRINLGIETNQTIDTFVLQTKLQAHRITNIVFLWSFRIPEGLKSLQTYGILIP